jgi:hypothetical protein
MTHNKVGPLKISKERDKIGVDDLMNKPNMNNRNRIEEHKEEILELILNNNIVEMNRRDKIENSKNNIDELCGRDKPNMNWNRIEDHKEEILELIFMNNNMHQY